MKSRLKIFATLIAVLQAGCSVFGSRSEETPRYSVLLSADGKEIRSYQSYLVAKTKLTGEYETAQKEGFRILADYIFGNNRAKTKIAMTAPVEQSKAPSTNSSETVSEKISMTAPVEQTPTKDGWVMSFMMPSKYTAENLPSPNDPRVEIAEVKERFVATISYAGSRSQIANEKKAEDLKKWILSLGNYEIISEPRSAGYDPPWTLPPFRRNEMQFDIKKK